MLLSWSSFCSNKPKSYKCFSSVQLSLSVVSDSLQSHGLQHTRPPCPSPLPEFTQTHVRWVGDAIQPSHPLSSPSPLAFNLSQHQGLIWKNESALRTRWPKYCSFSFNISPFNEHPGLISFRMGWLDLLAVQGTLKGLLQHHSSKASILWPSAFLHPYIHTHPYMTTGKTIALTRRTFVGKVMSLCFLVKDSKAWYAAVHGVTENLIWLSDWTTTTTIPVSLPGEFHGQRSLAGYSSWGCKESDMTEQVT